MNFPDANQQIRVSVVIPAYNAEKYLQRCLDSVLAQTQPADEIIVVDDGSADHTAEKVKPYGSAVRYLYQDNAGASVARNTGIQAARYEWIAFLDADDEWLPKKLELQTELLADHPDLVWCASNFILCSCQQNRQGPSILPQKANDLLQGKKRFSNFFKAKLSGVNFWTGCLLIKRSAIEEAGMFLPGLLLAQDLDLWYRIAYRWPEIGYIGEPLAIYHMDIPGSNTRRYPSVERTCALVRRHLELSAKSGCLQDYKPCAIAMIRAWIRGSLFNEHIYEIPKIVNLFKNMLSPEYRFVIRGFTLFPKVTLTILQSISWCSRKLKIRNKIIRKPKV